MSRLKTWMGVLLKDAPRFEKALRASDDAGWMHLCNRMEKLRDAPEGPGVECLWDDTSVLHAPTVVPAWGCRLMQRALQRDPMVLAEEGEGAEPASSPTVSIIIVHRGVARLPLLLATLRSVAAQQGVGWECVVVEDADEPEIRASLPQWVRYVHRCPPTKGDAFNRSAAFNAGVAVAQGTLLILHDNDLLMPANYAAEAARLSAAGYEVINLKRFIFYMKDGCTAESFHASRPVPLEVLQNAKGGGSIGMDRDAFYEIGGLDEAFVGWGEDVEFWDRAQTRSVWNFGYLPLVHLWHAPQSGKTPEKNTPGMQRLVEQLAIPAADRINALKEGSV